MADVCRYCTRKVAPGVYDTHSGCRIEFDRRWEKGKCVGCGGGERAFINTFICGKCDMCSPYVGYPGGP